MNRRTILIIASVVGVIIVAVILVLLIGTKQGTLTLGVTPADALIKLDGSKTIKAGQIKLGVGDHVIRITRDGFAPATISLTMAAGQKQTRTITLISNSESLKQQAGEADSGRTARQEGQAILANNPILGLLPHKTANYQVDYGRSVKYPGNASQVALYVTASDATGKTAALDWLKANGADPAIYEIIYPTP